MDSKLSRGKLKYLVKWEGYPNPMEWTWEPEESILTDNRAEFREKHPSAPQHIDIRGMSFRPIPGPFTDHGKIKVSWPDGKLSVQQWSRTISLEERVMLWTRQARDARAEKTFYISFFSIYKTDKSDLVSGRDGNVSWVKGPDSYYCALTNRSTMFHTINQSDSDMRTHRIV
jgi:Chromo (CHRromatin Organisation MOdifier) domain